MIKNYKINDICLTPDGKYQLYIGGNWLEIFEKNEHDDWTLKCEPIEVEELENIEDYKKYKKVQRFIEMIKVFNMDHPKFSNKEFIVVLNGIELYEIVHDGNFNILNVYKV